MPELPHTTYRLHPAEDLFHALALLLADPIALMSCGSAVNCAVFLLRCVRRGVERTGIRHEAFGGIEPLSAPTVTRSLPGSDAIITTAASRSAVPSACIVSTADTSPLRFSISTLPQ